jgi:hypothetical protein
MLFEGKIKKSGREKWKRKPEERGIGKRTDKRVKHVQEERQKQKGCAGSKYRCAAEGEKL